MPVVIAGAVIAASWQRFPLTTLLCILIAAHSAGADRRRPAYTYAPRAVRPSGCRTVLHTERNPYDKESATSCRAFVPALAGARDLRGAAATSRGRRHDGFFCASAWRWR